MKSTTYPKGWHEIVRENYTKTTGYIVAESGKCLDVQQAETRGPGSKVRGRQFEPIHPEVLKQLKTPTSWFLGVVLCPGDDVTPIAAWYLSLKSEDRERVVLYAHPDLDPATAEAAWNATGAPMPRRRVFGESWEQLHPLYGNAFSWRVWKDFGPK